MIKATGAQLRAFFNDPQAWRGQEGETYYEDALFTVDGLEIEDFDFDPGKIAETAVVTVSGGVMSGPEFEPLAQEVSLEKHFRRWIKAQNTVQLLIQCDRKNVDSLKEAIKNAGGRVIL